MTVAQAKLVAACPDGNECDGGGCISGSGSAYRVDGRWRSNAFLSAKFDVSATRTATSVIPNTAYRRQTIATTNEIAIHTSPFEPILESQTKSVSNGSARCSTTQRSRCR